MFNRGLYNRSLYNRTLPSNDIEGHHQTKERLDGWVVAGAEYDAIHRSGEQVKGRMLITIGQPHHPTPIEELKGTINPTIGVEHRPNPKEELVGKILVGQITMMLEWAAEELTGSLLMGSIAQDNHAAKEKLQGKITVGMLVETLLNPYEVLNGYISIYHIEESTLLILEPIPPGGKLIIDSKEFTLLLNNQNAIHLHRGDWIYIDRTTTHITVSGIGKLEWEVFYYPQYL